MFRRFRFDCFGHKLENLLFNNIGNPKVDLEPYDIMNLPLSVENLVDPDNEKPILSIFDNDLIFIYRKPEWHVFVGLVYQSGFSFWIESVEDTFKDNYVSSNIPTFIEKEIYDNILKNKEYYIGVVKGWITNSNIRKFGKDATIDQRDE